MPKHIIRRYLPHPERIIRHPALRFLGARLADPSVWHLNKRSAAGATFWGLWCAFLPMPLQMLPAAAAALLFRVNLPLCVVLVWVSNPLTVIPLLWLVYLVGSLLLGQPIPDTAEIRQLVIELKNALEGMFSDSATGNAATLAQHLEPLLLGTLVTGLLFGSVGYVLMRLYWRWHVIHAWQVRQKKRLRPSA
ncbi:MAG: DUF2062 domain-containing protein [Moraxellaceae bacterium]|nr:DUF2062 domain-containing protein [Moraxellaceae bacterium]